jgi:hypothetical protein
MFNHTPSPAALHNMAARLSQIRFSAFSLATKNEPLKQSPRSTNPNQAAMASLQQIQHDRMAQQATKSQQAGTRRPHYQSHQPQNADWTRPGGPRDVQAPSSKDHYQDWHEQRDELMKSLPRRPKQRTPLHKIDADMEQRLEPRGLRQQSWAQKASGTPRARISELNNLIDDYINWNQSSSDLGADLELDRPGTSGTLFVDFVENGDMEVSYRNGVNKKLPTPPLPPQIPTPASLSSLHRRFKAEPVRESKVHCKCVPPLPSHSARHDSVISSRTANADRIAPSLTPPAQPQPPPSRPLPLIPPQAPGPAPAHPRKSKPPQVHRTQRTSQVAPARHASPAPSRTSNTSFHTARTSRNREAYVEIPARNYNAPARAPTSSTAAAAAAAPPPPQKPSPSPPRKPKRHTRSKSGSTAAMPAHAQRAGAERRSKVIAFVQKMLQKLEHLKELPQHHRRRRDEPVGGKPSWVKAGYVT